jgi:hypothetical protein
MQRKSAGKPYIFTAFQRVTIPFYLFLSIFFFYSDTYALKASFAFNSGYIDAPYTRSQEILSYKKAMLNPAEAIAVTVSATEENLKEISKLTSLRFLYLDETFTKDSYYLSQAGIDTFFTIFSRLPQLEYISLCDSRLLPNLKALPKLKGLKIKKFDWDIFQQHIDNYRAIEVLLIEDSKTTRLPNVLGKLTSLRQLELHVINVTVFPDLSMLENLLVLRMSIGKITSLPATLVTLENLKYLKITGLIYFTEFPKEICSLKSLEELHIELRDANHLPEELGQLSKLRLLYLYDCNDLVKLPAGLGKLSALQEFHLSDVNPFIDFTVLNTIDHPFLLLLNRGDYGKLAKQLALVPNLKALVIPESTYPEIVKKIEKYLPAEKILKRNFTL